MSFKDKLTNAKLIESKVIDFEIREDDVILASNGGISDSVILR